MKIAQLLFACLAVGLLVLVGCGPSADTQTDRTQHTEAQENVESGTQPEEIEEVDSSFEEFEDLDTEIDLDGLNDLDADLADLDW